MVSIEIRHTFPDIPCKHQLTLPSHWPYNVPGCSCKAKEIAAGAGEEPGNRGVEGKTEILKNKISC